MIHLDFILWMTLFPIAISISSYIDAKKYKVLDTKPNHSDGAKAWASIIIVFIWYYVGYLLY